LDRFKQGYFGTFVPSHNHKDELVKKIQKSMETRFHEIESLEAIMKDIPSSRRNFVRSFYENLIPTIH
jgi:transcriptional regulator GlxA family with amidase domain